MHSSDSTPSSPNILPFILAGIHVDPSLNAVTRNGRTVVLEPQVMRLLLHLSSHADQTCPRESIMESVWPDSLPNEEALTQAISKLRKALGDTDRTVIKTVRKVGYRLHGPVTYVDATTNHREDRSDATPVPDIPASGSVVARLQPHRWVWKAAAVLLVGFAISRFKVVAVHHDGVEGPRMVAVRMMDEGAVIKKHRIAIHTDTTSSDVLTWTPEEPLTLTRQSIQLLEDVGPQP